MQYVKIITLLTLVDQVSKILVLAFLKPIGSFEIMPGIFYLTYAENPGAVLGLLNIGQTPLNISIIAATVILIYCFIKNHNESNVIINLALSSIIAGALGNLVDRVRLGYVVDFFNISLFKYPIFNVADVFIIGGAIIWACTLIYNNTSVSEEK